MKKHTMLASLMLGAFAMSACAIDPTAGSGDGQTASGSSALTILPVNFHPFTAAQIDASGLNGAGGIDQGGNNDCVFEAALAAVAMTTLGQNTIANMIVENRLTGSFTVTFPGALSTPVTLAASAVTSSALSAEGVVDSARWADVLEAAMISLLPGFANDANLPAGAKGAMTQGQSPTPAQFAFWLLTGNPSPISTASASNIGTQIATSLSNQQPVIVYCANNDNGSLVSGHEWTVMGLSGTTITLRNPWGHQGTAGTSSNGVTDTGNGEVTMSLATFGKYFQEVTFGQE